MNHGPTELDDSQDRLLAELEDNPSSAADSTLRNLHGQLQTIAEDLRQPLPPDPHEAEGALQQAVLRAREIGRSAAPSKLTLIDREFSSKRSQLVEIGPYQLLEKLGQGGMGAVYKALHTRVDKVVALKLLPAQRVHSAESVARFQREMKAVGKLDHPHIVRAMDAGEANGVHYLVMEYVEGMDLSELLEQRGPLPIDAACELVRQAALGLQAAHSRGMVHRDIKPANLMLAKHEFGLPVVKVLDLGLARLADVETADAEGLSSDGHIMGTIEYMAPEQAVDSHNVDYRADIYSLGATLYALLSGSSMFRGHAFNTVLQRLSALATEPIPAVADRREGLPDDLCMIIHRMLDRDPAARFATPAEVAIALEPFAAGADLAALFETAPAEAPANLQLTVNEEDRVASTDETTRDHLDVDDTNGFSPVPVAAVGERRRRRPPVSWLAIAALAGAIMLSAILLSLKTPQGEIIVELGDDVPAAMAEQLKIEVLGNGNLQIADLASNWTIGIEEGKYTAQLAGGDDRFQLDQNQLSVIRGKRTLIRVTLKPPRVNSVDSSLAASSGILIAHDAFDYTTGYIAGKGAASAGWAGSWQTYDSDGVSGLGTYPRVADSGLSYTDSEGGSLTVMGNAIRPGTDTFGNAMRAIDVASGSQADAAGLVESARIGKDGPSVWLSFLASGSENHWAGVSLYRDSHGSAGEELLLGKANGESTWGVIDVGEPEIPSSDVSGATPVFFVTRIDFATGRDHLSVWLNPDLSRPLSAANIASEISDLRFDRIRIAGSSDFTIDELRIGTTFRAVAPATGPRVSQDKPSA